MTLSTRPSSHATLIGTMNSSGTRALLQHSTSILKGISCWSCARSANWCDAPRNSLLRPRLACGRDQAVHSQVHHHLAVVIHAVPHHEDRILQTRPSSRGVLHLIFLIESEERLVAIGE